MGPKGEPVSGGGLRVSVNDRLLIDHVTNYCRYTDVFLWFSGRKRLEGEEKSSDFSGQIQLIQTQPVFDVLFQGDKGEKVSLASCD